MTTRVHVTYAVPVVAVVDVVNKTVERVIVLDESVTLDRAAQAVDADSLQELESQEEPIYRRVVRQAIEIAENTDWPAWDNGW